MANNNTVSTSTSVQYSGPSYYGDGPTLPHLVGFTLAIVSLAIALGFLRVLLLSCRSRRLAQREAAMRLGYDVEGGGPPAVPLARVGAQADPPKKEQPRVITSGAPLLKRCKEHKSSVSNAVLEAPA
ncbi:hypothetical protein WJX75_008439 [Coccomyxa subellipsoidea]|uniref:Uncharacterized protein n=1 Tax=Coccomyxa subellipsoidea TaxID=248742 RepID=A0ABR2Z4E4_9CHLO